jgi:uncharacterized membrane protein
MVNNNLKISGLNNNLIKSPKNVTNFFKKLKPANKIKMKSEIQYAIYVLIIFFVLIIIYISAIIYYLNKLKSCQCFLDNNSENYSNLGYLIGIQSIILVINIIMLVFSVILLKGLDVLMSGGGNSDTSLYYITFIILLLIYSYFIYYVYKLYQNIDEDCECAQEWFRYLLYFQVILMIIQLILIISAAIM